MGRMIYVFLMARSAIKIFCPINLEGYDKHFEVWDTACNHIVYLNEALEMLQKPGISLADGSTD